MSLLSKGNADENIFFAWSYFCCEGLIGIIRFTT